MERRGLRGPRGAGSSPCTADGLVALAVLAWSVFAAPARGSVWTDSDSLRGANAGDQFGWCVAGVGDLSGDGFADIGVGAHFLTFGPDTAVGAVDLFTGGLPPGAPPFAHLIGRVSHEHFGECLAGGRDINGNGIADLVVGAPLRDDGLLRAPGGVDVFLGGSALANGRWASLKGEAADDWFGQSVAVGDLDGDGLAEIIVGAPFNDRHGSAAGAVFIFRGGAQPPVTPWKVLVGEASNDQFGWSVTYLGDFDGDGYGDLAVGARLHSVPLRLNAGRAYLFRGGPAMDTVDDGNWTGEAASDWFGAAVYGPGDVDGGGRPDLLVGAPFNDRNGSASGAAYLFRGELAPGSAPAAVFVGESPNAQLGFAVGGADDVNGDGRPDIVVGAPFQASGLLGAAGRTYLFAGGSPLSTVPLATADGEAADDWFGHSVGGVRGYFNASRGAVLAGAPLDDRTGSAAGRAYALGNRPATSVPPPGIGVRPLAAWPMPAREAVELAWPGSVSGRVEVAIQDLTGRDIRRWSCASDGSQGVRTRWDTRDLAGRSVPTGVYWVRMSQPGAASVARASTRIVVLR